MKFKKILVFFTAITVITGFFYYEISPFQNCLRMVEKKIEDIKKKLATETDVHEREKLETDQKELFYQVESGCFERTIW